MTPSPEYRPVLKINCTKTDYLLEAIALGGLIAVWVLALVSFAGLPDNIPTHFAINGKADAWGSKANIFFLPTITIVLYAGMSLLMKYPHKFNYPVRVTAKNALQIYSRGIRVIRILKVIIVFTFLIIEWTVCSGAENTHMPVWFLPSLLAIPVLLPIFLSVFLTRSFSEHQKRQDRQDEHK